MSFKRIELRNVLRGLLEVKEFREDIIVSDHINRVFIMLDNIDVIPALVETKIKDEKLKIKDITWRLSSYSKSLTVGTDDIKEVSRLLSNLYDTLDRVVKIIRKTLAMYLIPLTVIKVILLVQVLFGFPENILMENFMIPVFISINFIPLILVYSSLRFNHKVLIFYSLLCDFISLYMLSMLVTTIVIYSLVVLFISIGYMALLAIISSRAISIEKSLILT